MLAKVISCAIVGLEAELVEVEVDVNRGGPAFTMVGLPDAAVRESRDRVYAAIRNSGLNFPQGRITVNLAPADLRKEGPAYDL
ncbi:MAG TPA: magnesium chelatase domain-containing protein, partial [Candidatus Sulfomarinibacteraceae bacterium]|nr:magnesium chelatase domain-containing protein [Candidatus Sulfomarinibacteraceae bacterium]